MSAHPISGGLALAFQEPLTAILRVNKADNKAFRSDFLRILKISEQEALQHGYAEDEIAAARFAIVVFLDEAVLKAGNPSLAGWDQLQFELYQRADGGEVFFQKLKSLLGQGNTSDAADLLEVYDLCILLGFQGDQDERSINTLTADIINKIAKIRKGLIPRSPPWSLPEEPLPSPRADPWIGSLLAAAIVSLLITVALLIGFKMSLNSGAEQIRLDQSEVVR